MQYVDVYSPESRRRISPMLATVLRVSLEPTAAKPRDRTAPKAAVKRALERALEARAVVTDTFEVRSPRRPVGNPRILAPVEGGEVRREDTGKPQTARDLHVGHATPAAVVLDDMAVGTRTELVLPSAVAGALVCHERRR